ncbi:girdin-like [Acanthochromis polyacanthus]|uniref:girdin-like n=1 Tax=Acanthochromis polyacanthus TaxID=80966 RepID=UPI0022346DC9|nr:girdin-like [Acanthochromis polyacanthus]
MSFRANPRLTITTVIRGLAPNYRGPNHHHVNPAAPRSSRGASQEENDFLRQHIHNMSLRIQELITEKQQHSSEMLSSKATIKQLQEKEKELQNELQQKQEQISVLESQLREHKQVKEPAENTMESDDQQDFEASFDNMKTSSMNWGDYMDDVDEMREQLELKDREILKLKNENQSLSAALKAAQNLQREGGKSLEDSKEMQQQKKALDEERKEIEKVKKDLEQKAKDLLKEKVSLLELKAEVQRSMEQLEQKTCELLDLEEKLRLDRIELENQKKQQRSRKNFELRGKNVKE